MNSTSKLMAVKFKKKIDTVNKNSIVKTLMLDGNSRLESDKKEIIMSLKRIGRKAPSSVELVMVKDITDELGRPLWFVGTIEQYRKLSTALKERLLSNDKNLDDDYYVSEFFKLFNPWSSGSIDKEKREFYYKLSNVLVDVKQDVVFTFTSKKYAFGIMEALYNDYYKKGNKNVYTLYTRNGKSFTKVCESPEVFLSDHSIAKTLFMYTVNKPVNSYLWDEVAGRWIRKKPFKEME